MKSSDFSEFLQELKQKNDIIDVIGSYIKLDRKGMNYWACCPFHHEKTPSFSVNAPDGFYHCFGCSASGDAIRFVQEYENVEFMQAVQILADRAGLKIPTFSDEDSERIAERKRQRDTYLKIMLETARFYLKNLYSGNAGLYLDYLAKRGLSPSTVKAFGLGASLDYHSLPAMLLDLGYSPEDIVGSGACTRTEDGKLIDFEGGRLIFPIINNMGEVIAFGGRTMKQTKFGKYKNTSDTLLFNKSKTLYNINLVKKEKKSASIPSLIMVEGYMDTISLYQAGFKNVVASMGTSLTKEQAQTCKRYSDVVLISYDGDTAGQTANLRGLEILKEQGLRVRVVPMPEGLDPDEVIKKDGPEGYQRCLDDAMPLIDFRILALKRKYDMSKIDERSEFVKEALFIVREAESATEQEELIKRIASIASVSQASVLRDFEGLPKASKTEGTSQPRAREDNADREKKAARFVLAACLLSKPYAVGYDLSELEFEGVEHRTIAKFIIEGRAQGKIRPSGIFDIMDADGELSEVLNLDSGDYLEGENAERFFQDSVKTLLRKSLCERIAQKTAEFAQAETLEERRRIALELNELTKKQKNVG